MSKTFSPDIENRLTEALERTKRFTEGTPRKEIEVKKPFIKRIKDWTREVNEKMAKTRGKILFYEKSPRFS